ncbi:MAG: Ppx/GppA family phosphatase [Nocardioidaceae bacterium]|nr:Ppx/GppA family phosphatase [Nocardioidaceae bacterium]
MSEAIAAIDCGTNTIKLLVGDPLQDSAGLRRATRMIRLGQGVDATGRLAPEALARAWQALDEYAAIIAEAGVRADRIRFCATSATRDAENSAEFVAGVRTRLGVDPEVLSGDEEARLAFAGAMRGLVGLVPVRQPALVVDIGGGSTELILGDPSEGPTAAHSMNIGAVRLHERHVRNNPINATEIAAVTADVEAALDASPLDPARAATVVGVAGTVTTLAAGTLDLASYSRERIHGQSLRVVDVRGHIQSLVSMSVEERLQLPWMHPGRADVIDAGALILDRILARTHLSSLAIAESDILDGIAWSLL